MTLFFTRGMAKAGELTHSGKLHAATALIQPLLHRPVKDTSLPAEEPASSGSVIDRDFIRLEPEATSPMAAPPKEKPQRRLC